MIISTERLELHVLDAHRLGLLANDMPALEKALDCTYRAEPLEGFFRTIVEGQLKITRESAESYVWHSFWLLIRRSDRVVVGSADFKAEPNEAGEVEIGYGLGKDFEGSGYMTEAVREMCAWAHDQPKVRCILAETETDNIKSQNVLLRCGFKERSRGETLWWQL